MTEPAEVVARLAIEAAQASKRHAVMECVTWLAQNHAQYKPEFLAEELANAMFGTPTTKEPS